MQPDTSPIIQLPWVAILVALAMAASAELLFRGVVHGILLRKFRGQKVGGKWFLSWPVIIAGLLYSIWACIPFGLPQWPATVYIVATVAALFAYSKIEKRNNKL
jgi:membrane protease YdiL (CAAX protease family)